MLFSYGYGHKSYLVVLISLLFFFLLTNTSTAVAQQAPSSNFGLDDILITTNGYHTIWPDRDIPIPYNINPSGFSQEEIDAINKAFQTWGSVSTSRLRFNPKELTDATRGLGEDPPDGINLIIKISNLPSEAANFTAETKFVKGGLRNDPYSFPDKHIEEVDIIFNGDLNWERSWLNIANWYDTESIALHEIGHFIGLKHPNNDNLTKSKLYPNGTLFPNDKDRESVVEPIDAKKEFRSLYPLDIEAASYLYPTADIIYVDSNYSFPIHSNCSEITGATDDPYCKIQDGIDAAKTGNIVLVADGTYYENINFNGKVITLKSVNGAAKTIIDGSNPVDPNLGSVARFISGEGAGSVLDGFTLTRGSGSNISGHGGPYGGGIICYQSSPTISNCIIYSNTNCGIQCYSSSSPSIANCTITDNSANGGGGINCYDSSSPSIANCIINKNNSAYGGGGIAVGVNSYPSIINCTVSSNTAFGYWYPGGGGIQCHTNSHPAIVNSIFWNNIAMGISNANEIHLYNSSSINITYSDILGSYSGTGNINADPLFVNVAGGNFHLQAGSPCIDTGTSAGAPATDIEGTSRPQGAGFDMGAYENCPTPFAPASIRYPSYICGGSFTINWEPVSGATNYTLRRANNPSFTNAAPVYNGGNTSYSESSLANGTYYYQVHAANDCGYGDWENGGAVTVSPNPAAPTVSSSTHPNQSLWYPINTPVFTWTPPADPAGIVGYNWVLDHSLLTSPKRILKSNIITTAYSKQADGVWYFHVRAKDGASNWGVARHYMVKIDTAAPTTPVIQPSPLPNTSGWFNTNSLLFTWHATDVSSGIQGYTWTLDTNPLGSPARSNPQINTSASYIRSNGAYYFHVRAVDNAGNWGKTTTYKVQIDATAPNAPTFTSLTFTNGYSNPTFRWIDSDATSGIAGYYYALDTPGTPTNMGTAAGKSYTGLSTGQHTFYIQAVDKAGNWSAATSFSYTVN